MDGFRAVGTGCFQGPLRGRSSPVEGPGLCIGGVMTLSHLFGNKERFLEVIS